MTRLFGYVRPHVWLLGVSLALVAVVGALEAVSPFLIGLVFDIVLHASSTPTIAIPVIGKNLSLAGANGTLFLVSLVLYPTMWFSKRLRSLSRSNQQEMADMANVLYETIAGNRIVKAFTMEKAESEKFRNITQRIFRLNIRQKMTHALSSPMMEV